MDKHMKQELFLLSIILPVILTGIFVGRSLFAGVTSEDYDVKEGTVHEINEQEEIVTVNGFKIRVSNLDKYEEGQKVKVWMKDRADDVMPEFPIVKKIEILEESG